MKKILLSINLLSCICLTRLNAMGIDENKCRLLPNYIVGLDQVGVRDVLQDLMLRDSGSDFWKRNRHMFLKYAEVTVESFETYHNEIIKKYGPLPPKKNDELEIFHKSLSGLVTAKLIKDRLVEHDSRVIKP